MAIEAFFPVDLLMDACILATVQSALDRPCLRRHMRTMLVLAAITMLCVLLPGCAAVLRFASFSFSAAALVGHRGAAVILEAALAIFCGYAACAGFMLLTGSRMLPAFACMAVFCLLICRRRHIRNQWNIALILEKNGCRRRFTALIDTGNRLRHRAFGLPVLIAEERLLIGLIDTIRPEEQLSVPYGVLGSSGELICFHPDKLWIQNDRGETYAAPECLIGVFPSIIPGRTSALAPPEFARQTTYRFIPQIKFSRRLSHGILKHKAIHLWAGGPDPQGFCMLHRRQ